MTITYIDFDTNFKACSTPYMHFCVIYSSAPCFLASTKHSNTFFGCAEALITNTGLVQQSLDNITHSVFNQILQQMLEPALSLISIFVSYTLLHLVSFPQLSIPMLSFNVLSLDLKC